MDPEHYTTTLSDGMVTGSPWTYTYHNNVKFLLQNTSRSPVTIKKMAITWENPNVVLDRVVIGGAPSGTAAQRSTSRLQTSTRSARPSQRNRWRGRSPRQGRVATFDAVIADHADSTGAASGAIPVALRFTNSDGTTVNC